MSHRFEVVATPPTLNSSFPPSIVATPELLKSSAVPSNCVVPPDCLVNVLPALLLKWFVPPTPEQIRDPVLVAKKSRLLLNVPPCICIGPAVQFDVPLF